MGEILKIIHKKDRKDLFSGTGIMVMNASDLDKNYSKLCIYRRV